jgi:steroid delta-isomerase-like uncharacterized protein
VLVGRYVALLDTPTNTAEFQHADCAPRSTLGDGVLSLIDWVQAGRYAARLDDLTLTGGPVGASLQGGGVVAFGSGTRKDGEIQRQIKVADAEIVPGLQGNVSIQLVSQGNENAIGFSLLFDPAVLTYQSASAGADAPAASLTVNDSQAAAGRVALLLALPPGADFAAGTKDVVRLAFKLAASASGTSAVSLTDQPVRREVSDAFALSLPADYVSGKITVGALPTLAIAHAGGMLTLAWPAWATNFVAQEAVSLEATSLNWTNVPASPVLSNGQNVLQVPAPASTRFFRLQLAAFPDLRMDVQDIVADGTKVVARVRYTGTQQGDFQGMPATGKSVDVQLVDFFAFDSDGRVREHWGVLDQLTLLQQLGVVPVGAPA